MIGASEFQARALDKRYFGVAIAIVTDNVDPEKQGRVKVLFPWYDDKSESDWCRVVYVNAGPGHGLFSVPEVDAEVLVAFEHGDMRLPYVIGALYNGKDAPPTDRQQDATKDEKLLQTRAGHRLLLRDTQGDTLIALETKEGQKLTLRDEGKSGSASITLLTKGEHTLTLDDREKKVSLTTSGGHKLQLDDMSKEVTLTTSSGHSITIDATGALTVKATTVKVQATQVELGQVATQHVILGEMFMAYFNTHMHPTAWGPSGPPVVPMSNGLLSTVTKTG